MPMEMLIWIYLNIAAKELTSLFCLGSSVGSEIHNCFYEDTEGRCGCLVFSCDQTPRSSLEGQLLERCLLATLHFLEAIGRQNGYFMKR